MYWTSDAKVPRAGQERQSPIGGVALTLYSLPFTTRGEGRPVVAVVWQFTIHEKTGDEFERFYGADGDWTKLSRKSRSFLGSSFLKDLVAPTRYLLVEYWSEMLVYEKHVADFGPQLEALEARRKAFAVTVESLGVFSALDVPTRVGPVWSRRSGG